MMMPLLGFTFVVIFGVVTSQNLDVNLQAPYKEMTRKRSVEATTVIPPDPQIEDPGMRNLLSRLENLFMERLEYLITEVHSTVNNLEVNNNLLVKKMDNLTMEVGRISQVVQNSEVLEGKVENLGKSLQELMGITRNVSSDVQAIKQDDSSLINVTRSLVDLSSNSELKQIFNKGLQELKDLQTSSSNACPLNLDKQYPRNCREVQQSGKSASGTYMIQPEHAPKPFQAVCDLETRGGGWTVIQRRFDGSQDFYLGWENYKNGFGNLGGELWLGLEKIYLITGFEINELLIELGDFESQNKSAFYSEFSIRSEMEGYSIKVLGGYSGDAGDSFSRDVGRKFYTKDNNPYNTPLYNYAEYFDGAWWYTGNTYINLNGKYYNGGQGSDYSYTNIYWFTFKSYYSLKHTRMLVRPKV